jgi:hypothetical protein
MRFKFKGKTYKFKDDVQEDINELILVFLFTIGFGIIGLVYIVLNLT